MLKSEFNGMNVSFTNAAVVATGGAATIATGAATVASVEGVFATALASGAGKALSLVDSTGAATSAKTIAANQACVIICCVDAAGAMKNIQSKAVNLDAAGALVNPVQFPDVPDTLTPFAYLVVKAGSTSSGFTPGTTNWNATGVTTTVVNVSVLPQRPLFP